MLVERKVKLVTEQRIIDKESPVAEFPMREWSIKLFMVDSDGNEKPASCFNKVVYNLHPSFENPRQEFHKPPFECKNEGWGEFELSIDLYYTEKTKISVIHDLNFRQPTYEIEQSVSFKNPSQALQEKLRELGPLPTDEDRPKKKMGSKKTAAQKFDIEQIANGLLKLEEDDMLKAIKIINDNKGPDTYIKVDLDAGDFSVDLYTLPDVGIKLLHEFLNKKGTSG